MQLVKVYTINAIACVPAVYRQLVWDLSVGAANHLLTV
jgi:hypothetical protein